MQSEIPIRCSCGQLQGVVTDISPSNANHVVCCCVACQKYAHMLERSDEILDEHGGTEVFQISPRCLTLSSGQEQLACLQITPKKGALRFYTTCCHTPIAHTLPSLKMPFLAMNHMCVDHDKLTQPLEASVGPVRATVNKKFPRDMAVRLKANGTSLLKMILHFAPMFFWWLLRGDAKRSPFVEPKTHKPLLIPSQTIDDRVLPEDTSPAPQGKRLMGCG